MPDFPGIPSRNQLPATDREKKLLREVHELRARDIDYKRMVQQLEQKQIELRLKSEDAELRSKSVLPIPATPKQRVVLLAMLITALGGGAGITELIRPLVGDDELAKMSLEVSTETQNRVSELTKEIKRRNQLDERRTHIIACWIRQVNGRAFARGQTMDCPIVDDREAPPIKVDLEWPP